MDLDGKIYVIGGQNVHVKKLDTVEVYDPLLNKWDAVAPLPVALDHAGVASDNGKLYVVGGSTEKHHTTNKLFIYDSNKDVWNEGKPMPTSRTMLTADFVDGYFVCRRRCKLFIQCSWYTTEAYDPKTDTWVEKKEMSTPRQHATSEVIKGRLYIIGGRLAGDGKSYSVRQALLSFNNNEVYNPLDDSWTSLPPMPTNRSSMAAASINEDIYVFGGQSRVKTPADILVFGGRSDKISADDSKGIGILFTGQSPNGTLNNNEKYNTAMKTWRSEIPLRSPRLGLDAVAVGNSIYVIGGKPSLGSSVTGLMEIYHTNTP